MSNLAIEITLMLLFTIRCGFVNLMLSCYGFELYYTYIVGCRCCERGESRVQMLGLVTCPKLKS